MKQLLLLLFVLICACCQQNKPVESEEDYSGEIVITGRILNRDYYPKEKMLALVLPSFNEWAVNYVAPIKEDQTFSFRFVYHAAMSEVGIRNYADHLYVRPGDSLHVEIDFKDMLHPRITGTAGDLNRNMSFFTDGGYYLGDHTCDSRTTPDIFEVDLKKEYADRLERREEFLKKYQPGEVVEQLTANLLKVDYYKALFQYAGMQSRRKENRRKYTTYLSNLDTLFSEKVISANLFKLSQEVFQYLLYEEYALGNRGMNNDSRILECVRGNAIMPYFYISISGNTLLANDTASFAAHRKQFDSIVEVPHLRYSILRLYNAKREFLNSPEKVSDYMLYGHLADMPGV